MHPSFTGKVGPRGQTHASSQLDWGACLSADYHEHERDLILRRTRHSLIRLCTVLSVCKEGSGELLMLDPSSSVAIARNALWRPSLVFRGDSQRILRILQPSRIAVFPNASITITTHLTLRLLTVILAGFAHGPVFVDYTKDVSTQPTHHCSHLHSLSQRSVLFSVARDRSCQRHQARALPQRSQEEVLGDHLDRLKGDSAGNLPAFVAHSRDLHKGEAPSVPSAFAMNSSAFTALDGIKGQQKSHPSPKA